MQEILVIRGRDLQNSRPADIVWERSKKSQTNPPLSALQT